MGEIKIYLCHYDSIELFETQVNSIRKFLKIKHDETLTIFGTVDSSSEMMYEKMYNKWMELDVCPIKMPFPHLGVELNDPPKSYGLCFNYIYDNYIKKDNYISLFIENDVIFVNNFDVYRYSMNYQICGDVRFYNNYLPVRLCQFWLGFLIFNNTKMDNRDIFDGRKHKVLIDNIEYEVDSGGQTYNWISKANKNDIRHIRTMGSSIDYDPYSSNRCIVHNITNDVENLPMILRDGYKSNFRCVNYENIFIHLERVTKNDSHLKINWIKKILE